MINWTHLYIVTKIIKYLNTFNVPLPYKLKKDITGINKETCDVIIKAYLESKGQAGSVTDIAIKPSVTKSAPKATSAGTGKNTAKKTDASSVGPVEKKPRASRKKKEEL